MFTQSMPAPAPAPAPSSSGLHVPPSASSISSPSLPVSPASPTARTSRLRGLSYLRSYTQTHLLNRDHSSTAAAAAAAAAAGPADPTATPGAALARSVSHSEPVARSTPPAGARLVRSESSPFQSASSISATSSASTASARAVPPPAQPVVAHQQLPGRAGPASVAAAAPPASSPSDPPLLALSASQPSVSDPAAVAAAATAASVSAPMTRSRSDTDSTTTPASLAAAAAATTTTMDSLPSIRFSTFHDPRSARPSLKFAPMSRTLPSGKETIRVGRYSERDSQPTPNPNVPSAAHVGFKSKVVSRRHCEFWFEDNRWYIKDVKSSSGTFLNHIRLSQPGTESKPFPVNDGDIVQLGIDFKGGEEMIFRCVKMRVELNRGWQSKLNAFNVNTHRRLRNMTKPEGDGSAQSTQDCSICLNSIAPCQSLFVAPCSHTWHYKCIRSLLESAQYPSFNCPNCRAAVDLEADVEDPPEEWDQMEMEDLHDAVPETSSTKLLSEQCQVLSSGAIPEPLPHPLAQAHSAEHVLEDISEVAGDTTVLADPMRVDSTPSPPPLPDSQLSRDHVSHATSDPVPIPVPSSAARFPSVAGTAVSASGQARTPSPSGSHALPPVHEGPITPRNDAGPWVFDGSDMRTGGGRPSNDSRRGEMRSLDTAAVEMSGQANA